MAVRWPDGSYTGSVKAAKPKPAPVEPKPEETTTELVSEKKEASNGNR